MWIKQRIDGVWVRVGWPLLLGVCLWAVVVATLTGLVRHWLVGG